MAGCEDPTLPPESLVEPGVGEPLYSHGTAFTTSTGIYRIPYADGSTVNVSNDHHSHSPVDRVDLVAGTGTPVVAAASGWIRGIVDWHGNSPNPGDGMSADSTVAQNDALEHACVDSLTTVQPSCAAHNNYVWIQHPNGEWTKYTHMGTGTVSLPPPAGFGWSVGDWIEAGDTIGLEDDIGRAGGTHLHFEVGLPNDPTNLTPFCRLGGFMLSGGCPFGVNLVPLICGIPNHTVDGILAFDDVNDGLTANPCNHSPPTADPGGPYAVNEGDALVLDGTNSNDPDGLPLTYRWRPDAMLNNPPLLDDSTLATPTFIAGTSMVVDIQLTVYDQVEALWDSASTTVTVSNVDPIVTIDPAQVTVIDENGVVIVEAEFTDPGFLDTHTATIDWGVPVGHEGEEVSAADIQILDAGGPGEPLHGRVTGAYRYGDNDDGSGFTIEVTVTDSDGGSGNASFSLTVNNVDPNPAIDLTGTVLLNGVPTVVASAGDDVVLNGLVQDPGSDDLTLSWDWGDGIVDSRLSPVNPPALDPLPSPTVQPRTEPDQGMHAFGDACLYEVSFSAIDDDDGDGIATVDVIVVGNADQVRGAGYWMSEYRFVKNPDFTPATLACYLDIINHASAAFSEARVLASFDDAVDVLWTKGTSAADDLFDRQLMTAWLNFANGAYALDQLVDATGDNVPDTAYLDLLVEAETLRLDPTRTRAALLAMKNVLEALAP